MAITEYHKASKKVLYYNVHGIMRIKSDVDIGLNYFKCKEPPEEIDLIIKTTNYKPIDKSKYFKISSGLYYSPSSDSIVSNMSILGLKVSWEVSNIESSRSELKISKTFLFLSSHVFSYPISGVHSLIALFRMILQVKMLLKNCSLVVGGCSVLDGRCIIFTGLTGSGKTITTSNFINTYGSEFMSDDFFITDRNTFNSYPTLMRARKFNLDIISYSRHVDPVDKFSGRITNRAGGDSDIYFLELSGHRFIREISAMEGINKLCCINNRSLLYSYERILSCVPYVYNDLSLLRLQKMQFEILSERLRNSKFFIISSEKTTDYIDMLRKVYR